MQGTLKEIFLSPKRLTRAPVWRAQGRRFALSVPLDVEGVTHEGLQLRGKARLSAPERDVMFQLQIEREGRSAIHMDRICWKPGHEHNNGGLGPKEFRFLPFAGSHRHQFDLNYKVQEDEMRGDNLPIAVPFENDPERFEDLVALVDSWFRIDGLLKVLAAPKWEHDLFDD